MRRVISFLLLSIIVCLSFAANYRVNVKSSLNLRAEPSAQSEILCKIEGGKIVDGPDAFETEWIHVNYQGQSGYLMAKYLTLSSENEEYPTLSTRNKRPWYYLLDWEGEGYRWMAYVILALSLVMWFEMKFIRKLSLDFTTCDDNANLFRWVNMGLLFVFAAVSITYVYLMGNNAMWFIFDVRAWYFGLLNFIFFVYVFINLAVFFVRTMDDIVSPVRINLKFGIIMWLVGVIGYVVCQLIANETRTTINMHTFFVIIGICQVVQVIIILIKTGNAGHILYGLLAIVMYAIGSVAIAVLLVPLVFMVLVMILLGLVFQFVFKMSISPGGVFSSIDGVPCLIGVETANSTDTCKEFIITNPEGMTTNLSQVKPEADLYHGSDGYTYENIGGEFRRMSYTDIGGSSAF